MVKLSYEEPRLKKYGTIKDFTLAAGGSGGDTGGHFNRNDQPIPGTDMGNPDNDTRLGSIIGDAGQGNDDNITDTIRDTSNRNRR